MSKKLGSKGKVSKLRKKFQFIAESKLIFYYVDVECVTFSGKEKRGK
jgi:hypothetical protein